MDNTGTPKEPRRFPWRVLVLFLLLVAAFGWYGRYNQSQRSVTQQVYEVLDARLENLDNSIRLHEKRIKDLEDRSLAFSSQPGVGASSSTPAPDPRIAALEKEMTALKSTSQSSAQPAQTSEQIYQAIHLLSAFHHLSEKVVAGRPFASELSAFDDADPDAANSAPVVALSPYADNGIPVFAQLLASFDDSLEALGALEATPPAGAGLWERFVFNLKHMINIRRTDEAQTDNSVDAILAHAQAHLDREEIEAAMIDIKSLPERERNSFAGWLEDARIATEAPGLIDRLEEQVMQKAFNAEPLKAEKGQP